MHVRAWFCCKRLEPSGLRRTTGPHVRVGRCRATVQGGCGSNIPLLLAYRHCACPLRHGRTPCVPLGTQHSACASGNCPLWPFSTNPNLSTPMRSAVESYHDNTQNGADKSSKAPAMHRTPAWRSRFSKTRDRGAWLHVRWERAGWPAKHTR